MCSTLGSYPRAWARRLSELSAPMELDVAGLAVRAAPSVEQLEQAYLPVLAMLAARGEALLRSAESQGPRRRLLAGLAGIGAGGKSTFASVLAHLAGRLLPQLPMAVVGMDGWHYPNAVLDARWTTDERGRPIPLRRRKGGPDSYDVAALAAAMRALRIAGRAVSLPVYDRRRHDVVEDGVVVAAGVRMVLIEGNYLLSDAPPWDEVSALLDVRLYLECAPAAARERMIARHIRGGAAEVEALRKYAENDRPNARIIAATAHRADYVIRL